MISGARSGANSAAKLWIEVGAEIRSAMANMAAIDRRVNESAAVVKRANPVLQGIGQGMGLAAIGSAALATKAVTDLVFASIDAASDLREAVTLTDQVFEGNSTSMQEWAAGAADDFGQSKREALNYAAGFGTAFKNVGMDLDTVGDHSRDLAELAADLGSAFNRGSEEAATALRSGLIGETEPMRRFGVFLSEAAVQAKAVQLGIADLGEELTDGEKVAARYAIIMEQTADSQGMFGRDSESLADAQKALAAEMENVGAELGEILIPAMLELAKTAREDVIPWLEEMGGHLARLAENTGNEVAFIEDRVTDLGNVFERLTPWDDWIPGTEMMHDGMQNVSDSVRYMAVASKDDLASVGPALDGLAGDAATLASSVVRSNAGVIASYDAMRSRMASAASGAGDAIYGPLIAKGQLAATEREMATQREIIAHGRSSAAAAASSTVQVDAIAKQIAAIEELEQAGDRAFAKRMGQFSDEIAAQLGIIDVDEQARRTAKRDADLAEQIAAAQADVASADPDDQAGGQRRLTDLLEQQEENRVGDAANARRQELRDAQKAIDAIVEHEREATDERKALAEARANAATIASDIAAAREAGDMQKVADLGLVLEAQRAEIAHLALEARHKDRQADLEREKAQLDERRGAVAASGASEVADAKQRLAELQATRIEQLALLASYGDQAAQTTLLFSKEIQEALIHGSEEVKTRILELRHELAMLRLDALAAAGALDFAGGITAGDRPESGSPYAGARAAGGPVRKDNVYLVGEEGPEPFVPWTNGTILPNDALAGGDRNELHVPEMAASSSSGPGGMVGGGGRTTLELNVTVTSPLVFDPYGDAAQQLAEALQPGLVRALARAAA